MYSVKYYYKTYHEVLFILMKSTCTYNGYEWYKSQYFVFSPIRERNFVLRKGDEFVQWAILEVWTVFQVDFKAIPSQ